jgi:phenylacetate-CoA ligase
MEFFNEKIETMPLDELQALQNHRLRATVERCYNTIPYYRKLLSQVGLKPQDIRSTDDLVHVPTTEKKDLRALYPFPVLGFEPQKICRFAATTGTTGTPVTIGFTRKDWFETLREQMGRLFFMWGIGPGDIVYQGYGLGLWMGGPSMELGTEASGATLFPAGPGRSHAAVEWLRDIDITVLLCSPSYTLHLIRTAKAKGIDPRTDWKIRVVMFGGEKASTEIRRRVENELPEGVKIFAGYGLTETGGPAVASECIHTSKTGEMHIFADEVFAEIVDSDTGKRLGPGEQGELVLTTLTREASPMIRWRTRDIMSWCEEPMGCPCGRNALPKIKGIVGRSDDMIKVRGAMFWPSQVEDILSAVEGVNIEGWQIYIQTRDTGLEQAKVEVEASKEVWDQEGGASGLQSRIASELSSRLGQRIEVGVKAPDSLPRYERKATRIIRQEGGN